VVRVDRRWGGVLVLVMAVIAALAGNGWTEPVAGEPVRSSLPAPPRVGDCAIDPVRSGQDGVSTFALDPAYTGPRLGGCASAHYGEVIAVLTDVDGSAIPYGGPNEPEAPTSLGRRCGTAVDAFLGVDNGRAADGWQPSATVGVAVVAPSAVLQQAGERWLACLAVADDGSGPGLSAYTGTLRNSSGGLTFPPELALCTESLPADNATIIAAPCDRPHPAELLGWVQLDQPTPADRAVADRGCADLAARLIGRADPTGGGSLEVYTIGYLRPEYGDGGTMDPDHMVSVHLSCVVRSGGNRDLTGPLLGLGDRPLPFG
jgi:hypothetical protein